VSSDLVRGRRMRDIGSIGIPPKQFPIDWLSTRVLVCNRHLKGLYAGTKTKIEMVKWHSG